MKNENELTDTGREYAAAYIAHYTGHDLPLTLQLYKKLLASHPNAQEADYWRMRVQSIVNPAVPKEELLNAQMALVLAHFEHDGPSNAERIPRWWLLGIHSSALDVSDRDSDQDERLALNTAWYASLLPEMLPSRPTVRAGGGRNDGSTIEELHNG